MANNIYDIDKLLEQSPLDIQISNNQPSQIKPYESIYNVNTLLGTEQLPQDAPQILRGYTMTQLENSPEFSKRAERFLQSVGRNEENIFEYLRDEEYSLSSALQRSFEVGNWNEQDQEDYNFLQQSFKNAKLGNFQERLNFAKDFAIDTIGDPLTLLSLFLVPATGGTSLAVKEAAALAGKKGLQTFVKGSIKPGTIGAADAGAWTGLHDYFTQSVAVGLGEKEGIDWGQTAQMTGIGAGFGGLLAGGIGGKIFLDKVAKYSNEEEIIASGAAKNRKEAEVIANFDKELNIATGAEWNKNPISWIAQNIAEKPVTKYLGLLKSADLPELRKILGAMRYDFDVNFLGKTKKGVRKQSYGGALYMRQGKYNYRLKQALRNLDRTGFFAHLSKQDEEALIRVLSDRSLLKSNEISPYIKESATKIITLLDEVFEDAVKAGLMKRSQRTRNYFPRIFNFRKLEKNRDKFAEELINKGYADPLDTFKTTKKILDETGEEVLVRESSETIDEKVFSAFLKDGDTQYSSFLDLARARLGKDAPATAVEQRAKELKANAIIDNMLSQKFNPFENSGASNGAGHGFLQSRVFDKISDARLRELDLLETDVENVLSDYILNASRAIERTNFFGRTRGDFVKRTEKVYQELVDAKMSKSDANKVVNKLISDYEIMTGINPQGVQNRNILSDFSDGLRLSQQMAHLPLAVVTSITEPLILLSRAGLSPDKALPVVGDVLNAVGSEMIKTTDKMLRTIYRGLGGTTKGGVIAKVDVEGALKGKKLLVKDLDDEVWSEVYETGLALEQAVLERLEGLSGEAINNKFMRGLSQGFFQANLLQQWTSAVQLASFTTGKRIIRQNAEKLYLNKVQGKNLSIFGMNEKGSKDYLTRQLNELGIDENDAIEWYQKSLKDGKFNAQLSKDVLVNDKLFYDTQYIPGANTFTKEIILNPSVAEGNKPVNFSSPAGKMLFQFLGYPTVFNNTIMKRFVNEMRNNGMVTTPKILGTTMLMASTATFMNYWRSNGKNIEDKDLTDPKDMSELFLDGAIRTGLLGLAELPIKYGRSFKSNKGDFGSLVTTPTGPLVGDLIEMTRYNKGLWESLASNLPGFSAYDSPVFDALLQAYPEQLVLPALRDYIAETGSRKKAIEKLARGLDKEGREELDDLLEYLPLIEEEESSNLIPFATGGLVKGPTVPNVKEDPADTINKLTGEPYSGKSPAELQMEELFDRENFVIGGIARALGKSVTKGKQKDAVKLRKNYITPEYLDTLKPKSKKAVAASEYQKSAKEVFNLLTDGKITIEEAKSYLKDYGYRDQTIKKIIRSFKDIEYNLGDEFISYKQ